MKKLTLSLAAILATSTFALAGGDIAPVEPVIETPYVEPAVGGFYLGAAYGWQNLTVDEPKDINGVPYLFNDGLDENFGSIMVDAGYKFNPYIAVEGRYWFGLSSSQGLGWTTDIPSDITIDAWGIYAKPMYPVTDAFNIYALLGYGAGDVTYDRAIGGTYTSESVDGFSWGLGADYAFTDNVSVFVDYVSLVDDERTYIGTDSVNISVESVNFGVNYSF